RLPRPGQPCDRDREQDGDPWDAGQSRPLDGAGRAEQEPGNHQQEAPGEHLAHPCTARGSSTSTGSRRWNRTSASPSPTTASAAAITRTISAIACPASLPRAREPSTSTRFPALSMISMHISMATGLRRSITPVAPVENRMALVASTTILAVMPLFVRCSSGRPLTTPQRHRADDCHQQERRRKLERNEQLVGVEQLVANACNGAQAAGDG